jgi:hypothetical protein
MNEVKSDVSGGKTVFYFNKFSGSNSDTTLQATVTGTGAVTLTVTWEQSIDGVGYVPLGSQVISGTNLATETLRVFTKAPSIRATVSGLSANSSFNICFAD